MVDILDVSGKVLFWFIELMEFVCMGCSMALNHVRDSEIIGVPRDRNAVF